MYSRFKFEITKLDKASYARAGVLSTPHGDILTPAFIFCATKAAIKGALPQQIENAGTQVILSNTYHLMLQPGGETVEKLGGLHKMMGWNGPMLTDSGGYQIFSLGHGSVSNEVKGKRTGTRPKTLLKINEEGAVFKSYIDGSTHILTPEKSIQIQKQLGADLVVVLDECTPFHVDKEYTANSMRMSHRWAIRSLEEFRRINENQALYGIIQGGIYEDLRVESAKFINDHEFFGIAIGGSLGANKIQMHDIVAKTMSMLSKERPVHLLGIGGVSDIFNGVAAGIDTFDCVHPTRLARHGGALIPASVKLAYDGGERENEHINLRNSRFKLDTTPIDPSCNCYTCTNFSKGYIHHLFKAGEMLGMQALTIHNIRFMNRLMEAIRNSIINGTFQEEKRKWVSD